VRFFKLFLLLLLLLLLSEELPRDARRWRKSKSRRKRRIF